MTPRSTPNRPIRSVETAFGIVEAISERNGAGVVELAEALDLAQSTVHDHLSTLVALEYVVQEGTEYRLGLKGLDHGVTARNRLSFFDTASEEMHALADDIDEVIWLYTEEYGQSVVIDDANREQGSGYDLARLGWRPPLHCTAAGKAILAHLSDDRIDRIVDHRGLPEQTPQTITTRAELDAELETIREQGYAINDEEHAEGIYAIGSPFVLDGAVLGAVTISGPSYRLSKPTVREPLVEALLDTTNQIELSLTYR
ncbi:IclR family transcriptional regulator [Salinadaptatus halalkaliphilus]|uniref:IclR family transcriptional regulator n=1 Tax=Salinadaptatus halalkaliphilus TaxID=2419781 RepID=A0A4S3TPP5_9EURY|nr:IclR family transcriptional regulator [Salinadaptatus halalkaliphilus]THE66334.1 IclR family transcriptional regulator [Salinadaptatus halalkaliphilus]